MLTQDRLKKLLRYDPGTGQFVRLVKTSNRINVGDLAGGVSASHKYCSISLDGRPYLAHRLAWLYMTGQWPHAQIDHIDMDRRNNKWENLRASTVTQNRMNRRCPKNNSLGLKGVSLDKRSGKYRATIKINYKYISLGLFGTAEGAHDAYVVAANKLFGEFSRAS